MLTIAVRSARDTDVDAVTTIYNQGIADRIATFETRLRTPDDLLPVVTSGQFPCMVATVASDVVGFASTSAYRERACYAGVAEFSIYRAQLARPRHRRRVDGWAVSSRTDAGVLEGLVAGIRRKHCEPTDAGTCRIPRGRHLPAACPTRG